MLDAEDALGLVFRLGQGGVDFASVDRGGDEYPVAHDDGSAGAFASDFSSPCEILFFAPFQRRSGRRANAIVLRPTPLVPVVGGRLGLSDRQREYREAEYEESREDFHGFVYLVFRFVRSYLENKAVLRRWRYRGGLMTHGTETPNRTGPEN